MKNKRKTLIIVSLSLLVVGLGAIALVSALRVSQLEPVAPTAPESRPAAQEAPSVDACIEQFSATSSSCGQWCDDNTDCDTGYCLIGEGATEGVCRNQACPAEGSCECQQHTICSENNTCEIVDGPGENECVDNADCEPVVHTECIDFACVEVVGEGNSQCIDDADCITTYLACRNEACVPVVGDATDECSVDAECEPNVETHLECVNEACVEVDGAGSDQCADDVDCLPEEHLECRDEACVTVSGAGDNECVVDNDCTVPTHLECRDEACVSVTGGGINQCSTNADCEPDVTPTIVPPTNTPVPGATNTPAPAITNTPAPQAPTPTPVSLPQAGTTGPTMMILTLGALVMLAGMASIVVW